MLLILLELLQKNNHLSFLDILVSLTKIMSKLLLVRFNKYTRSSKFLFNEHTLIWAKKRDSFLEKLNDRIWSI